MKLTHFLDDTFGSGTPATVSKPDKVNLAAGYLIFNMLGGSCVEVGAVCVPFQVTVGTGYCYLMLVYTVI